MNTYEFWRQRAYDAEEIYVSSVFGQESRHHGEDLLIVYRLANIDVTWNKENEVYHVSVFSRDWFDLYYTVPCTLEEVQKCVEEMIEYCRKTNLT